MENNSYSKEVCEFRDGVFALRTRRFGTVAEIMIKKLYGFEKSGKLAYDLKDTNNGQKIEVKFSTVMKSNNRKITEDNVIEQCVNATSENRALEASKDLEKCSFNCNIQQVKIKKFDVLYYGLFFADKIEIFKINKKEVKKCPGYSDFQHSGNKKEGQFHINNDSISWHRNKHLERVLDYQELYDLLKN